MKEITVSELKHRIDQGDVPFILDVRQPEEFREGHIEGATLIPLGELPARLGELNPQQEIVVNCQGGGRSARAVEYLTGQGFSNVANLVGGMRRWSAECQS